MKIIFIRHGKTKGNFFNRYIGKTDEILCEEGKKELVENIEKGMYKDFLEDYSCNNNLKNNLFHNDKTILVSPYKRCLETKEILFPDSKFNVVEDFRECDFGKFENKNYKELSGNKDYQAWIDSNGTLPFPEGEDVILFKNRCVNGFLREVEKCSGEIILVVHGGTIMSIFEKFEENHKNYYDYNVENGHGYITEFNGKVLKIIKAF